MLLPVAAGPDSLGRFRPPALLEATGRAPARSGLASPVTLGLTGPVPVRPHEAMSMTGIAQRVSRNFQDAVRARGQTYFSKGRVKILMARPGEVRTKVRGTESYRVRIRLRNNGRLLISCTCLYFRPHGVPCKHIWATLLTCDAKGLLTYPPVKPLRMVPILPPGDREAADSGDVEPLDPVDSPEHGPHGDRDSGAPPASGNGYRGRSHPPGPELGAGPDGPHRRALEASLNSQSGRRGPEPILGEPIPQRVPPGRPHPKPRPAKSRPGGPPSHQGPPHHHRRAEGNGHAHHAHHNGANRGGPGGYAAPRGARPLPIAPPYAQGRPGIHGPPARLKTKPAQKANKAAKRTSSNKRTVLYVLDIPATVDCHQVVIEPVRRQRKSNGDWGPLRPWSPGSALLGLPKDRPHKDAVKGPGPAADRLAAAEQAASQVLDEEDLEIFGLLERYRSTPEDLVNPNAAQNRVVQGHAVGHSARAQRRYVIASEHQAEVVERLSKTNRLRVRRTEAEDDPPTLRWDEGPAWKFRMDVRPEPGGRWTWRGLMRRGHEKIDLAEPLAILAPGLMILSTGRAARFDDSGVELWMTRLRHEKELTFDLVKQDEKLGQLLSDAVEGISPDDLIEGLVLDEVRATPQPQLAIRTPPQTLGVDRVLAELDFDYEGALVAGHPRTRMAVRTELRRVIRREPEQEKAAYGVLEELGFVPARDIRVGPGTWELPPKRVPAVSRELAKRGWQVRAEGKVIRPPGKFNLSVTTNIDWFELGGVLDFGDGQSVPLPELLAAARQGRDMVSLSDGSVGMLPEDWLKQCGVLAELGTSGDGHVRFGKAQAGLLDALLAAQPDIRCDEGFDQIRKTLRKFQGVTAQKAPRGFQGDLRPYQEEGLGWMDYLNQFGFGGILADDMGLGKTIQVLALLQKRRLSRRQGRDPSLIVVPRSLVFNWLREAEKFTPRLRVLDYTGPNRHDLREDFDDHDLIVTTYGTLRSDILELSKRGFDYVILDEAQAIKNAESQSAKAVRLLKGQHRLALTGTPIENHLGELWSILEFLNPGMLGSASVFKGITGGAAASGLDTEGREVLARSLRPFILRRTKREVVKDLPDKTEQVLYCTMEPAQRAVYDQIRAHFRQALLEKGARELDSTNKIEVLEALLRLRQAACHPGLIDKEKAEEPSAKLDMLMPQLTELIDEGHKALVFSQFTTFLGIVRDRLDQQGIKYEYLDGRTRKRDEKVERFQNSPEIPVFLISLKAGGLGLNLTSADYVYLLDPWWNPAIEAQAIDRSHRIGQTQHVFAYRLICQDTVEQKIVALQDQKRDLAEAILSGDRRLISNLTRDDLEFLLS